MTYILAVTLACIGQTPAIPDWSRALQDMQVANQEKMGSGTAKVEVIYTPPRSIGTEKAMVEGEVSWSRDEFFSRFRYHSIYGWPLGEIQDQPIETQDYYYYSCNESEMLYFSPYTRVLDTRSRTRDLVSGVLVFNPSKVWFACHPPYHKNGSYYSDMIANKVRGNDGMRGTVEFAEQKNNTVRAERTEPDGRKNVMVFSLAHGGNIVSFTSHLEGAKLRDVKGEYRWKEQDGLFVLDKCKFECSFPLNPDETDTVEISYKDVQVGEVSKSKFTKAYMESIVKEDGYKSIDRRTKKAYSVLSKKKSVDAMKEVIDALKAHGFGSRPK